MSKRNVYKGNRYVPKIMGEWNQEETYEGLSIVTNKGTSYTSKKRVPIGIDILDEEYWVVTGNYNAQIENYRQEVREFDDRMNDIQLENEKKINTQLEQFSTQFDDSINDIQLENEKTNKQLEQTEQQILDKSKKLVGDFESTNVRLGNLQVLTDAIAKGYVKIAFWGDSITTGGDYLKFSDTYVEQYIKKLREAFPNVTFEYQNFGIGGTTLQEAASATYTSPTNFTASWATTDGKSWRDYVKDYEADLVFIAFGMNPNASGASTTSFQLETIKIHLAGLQPSLILLSNFLPQEDFVGSTGIEERIISARDTNFYGDKRNLTVLNLFNRYRNIVDGKDENKFIVSRTINYSQFDNATPLRNSLFKTANFNYKENITLWDTNEWIVYFRKYSFISITKTKLKVSGFSDTTLALTDGGKAIEIEVLNNTIKVWIDNILIFETTSYFSQPIEDYLHIGWSVGTGAISGMILNNYEFGETNSKFTIEDIVGEYVPSDYTLKLPTGGNGVNHPSSKGFNYLYVPLIDEFIKRLKDELHIKPTITKTIDFDFIKADSFWYYDIPSETKYPSMVGVLEGPDGVLYTQNKTTKFSDTPDVDNIGSTEFLLRRSIGVMQVIVKPQSALSGWKFTTNMLI